MSCILTFPPGIIPIFALDNCMANICSSMSDTRESGALTDISGSIEIFTDALIFGLEW